MKRKISLLAAVLCLTMALSPAVLAAEPTQAEVCYPTAVTQSEDGTELRKMYDLGPEDDPAGISRSDFEQDGFHYTLVDVLKQELPKQEIRQHTETVSLESKNKDMESVLALLPPEKEFITEDGLSGTLSLQLETVNVETAGYGTSTREVSATRSYPNLANQDTANIPKTIEEDGRTLTLQNISWQTDNTASVGGYALGDRYTAVATYTGSATSSYVKGYTVTADYTGTVSRIALNQVRYVAIFEGTPIQPFPMSEEGTPLNFDWMVLLVPFGVVVLVSACIGGALFLKHRRENTMKRILSVLSALYITAMMAVSASALSYDIDAPGDPDYGSATSVEPVITSDGGAMENKDVSKNAAIIPPGFGTVSMDTRNTGSYLTPNLASDSAPAVGAVVNGSGVGISVPENPFLNGQNSGSGASTVTTSTGYTKVTSDLYYSGGYLGTLKIPSIDLSVKVYQGTDSSTLMKGAGHFKDTSIWDGNVCIAGHNRGVRDDFGDLHTLDPGDTITWTTKLGTRTYEVTSVQKVKETDTSGTAATTDNRLTLFTCVRDQRAYRWQVQAVEI